MGWPFTWGFVDKGSIGWAYVEPEGGATVGFAKGMKGVVVEGCCCCCCWEYVVESEGNPLLYAGGGGGAPWGTTLGWLGAW